MLRDVRRIIINSRNVQSFSIVTYTEWKSILLSSPIFAVLSLHDSHVSHPGTLELRSNYENAFVRERLTRRQD